MQHFEDHETNLKNLKSIVENEMNSLIREKDEQKVIIEKYREIADRLISCNYNCITQEVHQTDDQKFSQMEMMISDTINNREKIRKMIEMAQILYIHQGLDDLGEDCFDNPDGSFNEILDLLVFWVDCLRSLIKTDSEIDISKIKLSLSLKKKISLEKSNFYYKKKMDQNNKGMY